MEKLFTRFDQILEEKGLLAMGGQILDASRASAASIVEAPRQRNTTQEKEQIKKGETPDEWEGKTAKIRQKDVEARWTLKRGRKKNSMTQLMIPAYGYKSHIAMDRRHGLIRTWEVTDAAANDGKQLQNLLSKENTCASVWADTTYRSKDNEKFMADNGFVSKVHFRRYRNRDLTHNEKRGNRARSVVRGLVEHVFAEQKSRMGLFIRTIGIERAKTKIGLANIAYNMRRLAFLERRGEGIRAPA